jgi:hypothetical protein
MTPKISLKYFIISTLLGGFKSIHQPPDQTGTRRPAAYCKNTFRYSSAPPVILLWHAFITASLPELLYSKKKKQFRA